MFWRINLIFLGLNILGFLGLYFLYPETEKITVPEIREVFKPLPPQYVTSRDTVVLVRWRDRIVESPNPINDSVLALYKDARDSLERFRIFVGSIQIREFDNVFEDKNAMLRIKGRVQGKLLDLSPEYTIKQREVTLKKSSSRILMGIGISSPLGSGHTQTNLDLGFQNPKNQIFRIGYSRIGSEDYIRIAVDFPVFSLKRVNNDKQ